jgi:hypothetical protein
MATETTGEISEIVNEQNSEASLENIQPCNDNATD